MKWLSFWITVGSGTLYHVCQKSISAKAHPLVSLGVTYTIALCLTLCLIPFFPVSGSLKDTFTSLNWASFLLPVAIIGLEAGYLLVYRSGWHLGVVAALTTAAIILLLVPISAVFFREPISIAKICGVLLCVAGILLIQH